MIDVDDRFQEFLQLRMRERDQERRRRAGRRDIAYILLAFAILMGLAVNYVVDIRAYIGEALVSTEIDNTK